MQLGKSASAFASSLTLQVRAGLSRYGQKFGRNKPFMILALTLTSLLLAVVRLLPSRFHKARWAEEINARADSLVVPVNAGHYLQAAW